jgi:hypothetical protein
MDDESVNEQAMNAVPRQRVFVLLDGAFVVRWQETRVQELLTGQYRGYEKRDFGAPITDYELNQLRTAGIVEAYNETQVWLCPLPRHYEIQYMTLWEQRRTRSYYLNTTRHRDERAMIEAALKAVGLDHAFLPRIRDDFVILWRHKGLSFRKFDDAEKAREMLLLRDPETFGDTVVAFIETTLRA